MSNDENPDARRSSDGVSISDADLRAARDRARAKESAQPAAPAGEAMTPTSQNLEDVDQPDHGSQSIAAAPSRPEAAPATDSTPPAPAGGAAPASETEKPKKKGRRWLGIALILLVLAFIGWDIAVRAGDSEPAQPGAGVGESTGGYPPAAKADVDTVVRYHTLSMTKPAAQWCPMVAHPDQCIRDLAGIPRPGLRSAVKVMQTALVPSETKPGAGDPSAIQPESDSTTPRIAAVVVSSTTGENNEPGTDLVLVRPSDHKVIAELTNLDDTQLRYSAGDLAARVLAGQEPDAVSR